MLEADRSRDLVILKLQELLGEQLRYFATKPYTGGWTASPDGA
jgi:hypothetical protein